MSTITIPAEVVTILRSALIGEVANPTDAIYQATMIGGRQKHPEWFEQPVAELDRYRAALDTVGWGEPDQEQPITLDLDAHRQQIATALRTQLGVEHDYMAENAGKKDPEAQRQYAFAANNARIIEAFITVHRLADES